MRAVDFKYDGRWLSDAGYIICTFGTGGAETVSAGSNIDFHTVSQHRGQYFALTDSEYTEGYTATFNICKDAESEQEAYITEDDIRYVMRWLNRRTFHEFIPVGYYEDDGTELVFQGSFNVSLVEFAGRVIGFELTLNTNTPFAMGEPIEESFEVSQADGTFKIENISDEIGVLYPDSFIVTCNAAGALSLVNNAENRTTYIGNCSSGEVISMDCKNQIITTSSPTHKLYNDFNFTFPRLYNTNESATNLFSSSLPCSVTIKYKPIRKVVL